jgi:hypothetical protein
VLDDHDDRLKNIAEELKRPVRLSRSLDDRVMRAVRRLPHHARFRLWSRLTTPRRVSVTPLSWGLLAAAMLLFAVIGTRSLFSPTSEARLSAVAASKASPSPQSVQFVLVAPDAKKVAVVGDFNGWDASHAGFQAKHRGGGVWSVMAPVPLGHHRYSFVVDDSVWVADPIAPRAVDNDFGVTNSAIVVSSQE